MAMSYKTAAACEYQREFTAYVRSEAERQGWKFDPNDQHHIYVDGYFVFPRTRMDTNNHWKCMLDAITDSKAVWADDSLVCERTQSIMYDTESPYIRLEIYRVDYVGIFKNDLELDTFESKCSKCSRYSNNCSLLNKVKEGRIIPEIQKIDSGEYECEKFKFKKGDNGHV